jgi:hypothetical protein
MTANFSMLHQLIYRSRATSPATEEEISTILAQSEKNNGPLGISGCLIYYNERYIQFLEGKEDNLEKLYDRIKTDKRHYNVTTLGRFKAEERVFSNWKMAFIQKDKVENFIETEALLNEKIKEFPFLAESDNPASILFWIKVKSLFRT